jgi:hypothetical protein
MERRAVRSQEIAIVGYDAETLTLEIVFRRGGVYHYTGVPEEIYKGLMTAPSRAIYFSQSVKEKYPYQKIR